MNLTTVLLVVAICLLVIAATIVFRLASRLRSLRQRFAPVLSMDDEIERLRQDRESLRTKIRDQREAWDKEFAEVVDELARLNDELDRTRDSVEMQSCGVYEPIFDFDASDDYRTAIDQVRARQKELIRSGAAAICGTEWQVGGSRREGRKLTRRYLKLQLRAFNGEADAAIAKVRYNNVGRLDERLGRARDAINKLGMSQNCRITDEYLQLKRQELHLAYEYAAKKQEEIEEQREIRRQMREEAQAQKEIEKAQREAEREEERYNKALERARKEVSEAQGLKQEKLTKQIEELERRLAEARENKERAISRAQLTKSGHVYVLSNIGSFGDRIYKIGMTRRLDPIDRVRELGDASVPFPFDVHAMIFSKDAPKLETELHQRFAHARVNLVNLRREYFYVEPNEIEGALREHDGQVRFTKAAEAAQFRQSQAMRAELAEAEESGADSVLKSAKERLDELRARWQADVSEQLAEDD